jgi:hypothetical protein
MLVAYLIQQPTEKGNLKGNGAGTEERLENAPGNR